MNKSSLADAFGHHVWATLRLLDACLPLSPEQLELTAPGTYGSILETMRHLVGSDSSYLFVLTRGRVSEIEEAPMDLAELRAAMERNGAAWASLLEQDLDPDAVVIRHRDDGIDSHAPMGIRLAQAVHHGTDHRSQICTILTTMGIEPPAIDAWELRGTGRPPRRGPSHVLTARSVGRVGRWSVRAAMARWSLAEPS